MHPKNIPKVESFLNLFNGFRPGSARRQIAIFPYLCNKIVTTMARKYDTSGTISTKPHDEITDREKAVIIAAIFYGKDKTTEDWRNIYALSRENRNTKTVKAKNNDQTMNGWKSMAKVKRFYAEEKQRQFNRLQEIENNAVRKFLTSKTSDEDVKEARAAVLAEGASNGINFRDRETFLNYLNDEANRISDDKMRLDVLKMLSDLQRLKEADSGKGDEIQRFYVPQKCEACKLYLAERDNLVDLDY